MGVPHLWYGDPIFFGGSPYFIIKHLEIAPAKKCDLPIKNWRCHQQKWRYHLSPEKNMIFHQKIHGISAEMGSRSQWFKRKWGDLTSKKIPRGFKTWAKTRKKREVWHGWGYNMIYWDIMGEWWDIIDIMGCFVELRDWVIWVELSRLHTYAEKELNDWTIIFMYYHQYLLSWI